MKIKLKWKAKTSGKNNNTNSLLLFIVFYMKDLYLFSRTKTDRTEGLKGEIGLMVDQVIELTANTRHLVVIRNEMKKIWRRKWL